MIKQFAFIITLFSASMAFAVEKNSTPYILVLGIAQDGGYPHMGCKRKCCSIAWTNASKRNYVVSLALVDPKNKKWWLFEATPDVKEQLQYFQMLTNQQYRYLPDGIFITHAHIGHYAGLMQLGREVMGAKEVPVYVLPKLYTFLATNGPWNQLINLQNITLQPLQNEHAVILANGISILPFTVPHRDEYSETAGYRIYTAAKSYLFIPDINKWDKWEKKITEEVNAVDIAFVDATFYNETELPGKRISEVPHPFVAETMQLFEQTGIKTKNKIHFIHLNHTNPLLWNTQQQELIRNMGYNIAQKGRTY